VVDHRPEIPAWRRRPTAADLSPPESVKAELRRLEVERQRQAAARGAREPETPPVPTSIGTDPAEPEPEGEPEELTPGEEQKIRESLRALRGGR
jgi:hypothetical protein